MYTCSCLRSDYVQARAGERACMTYDDRGVCDVVGMSGRRMAGIG